MIEKQIFEDSFLISGIMCFQGCGTSLTKKFEDSLEECQKRKLLPANTQLIMSAEPQGLGIHGITINITQANSEITLTSEVTQQISTIFRKDALEHTIFELIPENKDSPIQEINKLNWINIAVNLFSIGAIISLYLIFPPSILLTSGLTILSFATSAFTARKYLKDFFYNLGTKNWANMPTTVSLGWLLSLIHTFYHTISMPLASSFSMIFMSFVMPVLLITIINGMDEIKRRVNIQAQKISLQGLGRIFPQMANEYPCYELSLEQQQILSQHFPADINYEITPNNTEISLLPHNIQEIIQRKANEKSQMKHKNLLTRGMLIRINRGECFPVNCILVQGHAVVDPSHLTGEHQQSIPLSHPIPAGAINLGQPVMVYALKDSFQSSVNQLLFVSNRADTKKIKDSPSLPIFTYIYVALIILGLLASLIAPFALGALTFSLSLQNITGILFAVCPCTIAIAHELPNLLTRYFRSIKGISIHNADLDKELFEIDTVIFDKTGTLTTGESKVSSFEGISLDLWQRIFLLEDQHGAEHPLAKAIINFYKTRQQPPMIQSTANVDIDPQNRGLSADVQAKRIHIGNFDYLSQAGIEIPESVRAKIAPGLTPIYVAENFKYQGIIYIKHEGRKNVLAAVKRLKEEGKKIIMLTGDSQSAAEGFNQQNGSLFDLENIHAQQTPSAKESFLERFLKNNKTLRGVWFIGDGLNDAPCAKKVTEEGGISCAMTENDKTSFFTDMSLNGSLDYLFTHNKLHRFLKKNIFQNQALLIYGTVAFIAFILSFSVAGIAVSPIIPLIIMAKTTLFVLFNSYRIKLEIDCSLDPKPSMLKQLLASDLSIGLLTGASLFAMSSLLISTIACGGLAFPAVVFSAGVVATISSICLLAATALVTLFAILACTYFFIGKNSKPTIENPTVPVVLPSSLSYGSNTALPLQQDVPYSLWNTPEKVGTLSSVAPLPKN